TSQTLDLYKECSYIKYQEELDKHNGYCANYEPSPLSIFEPKPETVLKETIKNNQNAVTIDVFKVLQQVTLQNQTIKQLLTTDPKT
ncbi:4696_t:CDS:1, partial [Gigaspora margarita]